MSIDIYQITKDLFNRDRPPSELECFIELNRVYQLGYKEGLDIGWAIEQDKEWDGKEIIREQNEIYEAMKTARLECNHVYDPRLDVPYCTKCGEEG